MVNLIRGGMMSSYVYARRRRIGFPGMAWHFRWGGGMADLTRGGYAFLDHCMRGTSV